LTRAEDLVRTDSESAALEKLRTITGENGGPMERHGLRIFLLADRLATARDAKVDREVLAADRGTAARHRPLRRGLPRRRLRPRGCRVHRGAASSPGWDEERIRVCSDAVDRHHELRSQWDRGAEVELIRRADLIDVSAGLVRFGLSGEWLRDLFRAVPRDGTYRTIGREVAQVLRHRPLTLPQIFRR
jgi:hypothetical protein